MKRFIPLLLVAIFSITTYSCKNDDDVPMTEYPQVYDLTNVNFELIDDVYTVARTINNPMYDSDVMLIYRQDGTTTNGSPIWRPLPITLYFDGGDELDYVYDFSAYDFQIYAGSNFPIDGSPYIRNQTFRVVLVPAAFGNKNADNQVDYNDYESVIRYFNIDDTNVGVL